MTNVSDPHPAHQLPGHPPAGPPRPLAPHPHPLAATPLSDWLRDGAAVVLLLVSLSMPWAVGGLGGTSSVAAGRIDVVLITILSVLSVGTTYLARFGVFGPRFTIGNTIVLRAALGIPYVLLVVVYAVLDATQVTYGLGAAVVFGLAGALFAASPRTDETKGMDARAPIGRAAYGVVVVLLVLAVLTTLVGLVLTLVDLGYVAEVTGPLPLVGVALTSLSLAAAGIVPLVLVLRRSWITTTIGGAVGIAVLVGVAISGLSGFTLGLQYQSLHAGGYPILWLALFAPVLTCPAVVEAMSPPAPLGAWFNTVRSALLVTGVVTAVLALFAVLTVAFGAGDAVGFLIGILLCQLAAAIAAFIARSVLVGTPARSRLPVLSIAGAIVLVEVIATILAAIALPRISSGLFIMPIAYLIVLGLPAVVGYGLTVPVAVREYFAAHAPARPPAYGTAAPAYRPAPTTSAPAAAAAEASPGPAPHTTAGVPAIPLPPQAPETQSVVPPAPAPVDPRIARAIDPSTPPQELYAFASDRSLWVHLAANPGLYPELRAWLVSTDDPQVLAVLEARGAS